MGENRRMLVRIIISNFKIHNRLKPKSTSHTFAFMRKVVNVHRRSALSLSLSLSLSLTRTHACTHTHTHTHTHARTHTHTLSGQKQLQEPGEHQRVCITNFLSI